MSLQTRRSRSKESDGEIVQESSIVRADKHSECLQELQDLFEAPDSYRNSS